MSRVYVLWHVHLVSADGEDAKLIGVYQTLASAKGAVRRLADRPGFDLAPALVEPSDHDPKAGFRVDAYELDRDHWTEGFESV
jgi:hypothetical protein